MFWVVWVSCWVYMLVISKVGCVGLFFLAGVELRVYSCEQIVFVHDVHHYLCLDQQNGTNKGQNFERRVLFPAAFDLN